MNNVVEKRILLISPDFDYSNGVTRHLLILTRLLSKMESYKVHFLTNRGDAINELRKNSNIHCFVYPFTNKRITILKHYNFYRFLIDYCLKNKIDIIHTHHRYPEFLTYFAAKKNQLRTVSTVHSLVKGLRIISFKSDKIIAVSESVRNSLIKIYRVNKSKITVLYNCIDNKYYNDFSNEREILRRNLKISQSDCVFLYAGRINKIKGIDLLISAFNKLSTHYPNSKLLLVGAVEDDLFSFDLSENILLFPSRKQIEDYYLITDFCVLPSRSDPFPYFMLESALFMKPFIGSRIEGIAEFIEDGINGLSFIPGNEEDLLDKMIYAIENKNRMQLMAGELKMKAARKCDCNLYIKQLAEIYNSLLNSK